MTLASRSRGLYVDFNKPLSFTFDGKPFTGYEGDTVASALYRAGVRVFSRSLRYARPRGLTCVSSSSNTCLVDIDSVPNQRASIKPLEQGMTVTRQNFGMLDEEMAQVLGEYGGAFPTGFMYKTGDSFPLREVFNRSQAKAGGLGTVNPSPTSRSETYFDKQYLHADVTVVGGGPAGISASLAAANEGARVVLIDENKSLGGHLRYQSRGLDKLEPSLNAIKNHQNITVLTNATAFGTYDDFLIGVVQGERLIKLRTKELIVATGRIEQPLVFHNNDLPGVLLGRGAQRLMHLYGVKPGERAVVATSRDEGWQVARDLLEVGVEVVAIADARASVDKTLDVPTHLGYAVQQAHGSEQVTGATLVQLDRNGQAINGTQVKYKCDLIVQSYGFMSNFALLDQSGCKLSYDEAFDDFLPEKLSEHVHAVGEVVGLYDLEAQQNEGAFTGRSAARLSLGKAVEEGSSPPNSPPHLRPLTSVASRGDKKFIDLSADATEEDVLNGFAEGFTDVQTLKRFTTITMGLAQGKQSNLNFMRVLAEAQGTTVSEVGRVTTRPPFVPVKLGVLAGRRLEPIRLTPLHDAHVKLGATFMNVGQWKRPAHYGDINAEVKNVRENVGLIDVSTLGKLELRGPDAVKLLNRIYTNAYSKLNIGSVRYGVMCNEEGVIIDDGVVARLADDHYLLTTTTGTSGTAQEWLEWWQAGWRYDVHIHNVTSTYAAMNIAGPNVREVLSDLTEIDVSNEASPYMTVREGLLAGVQVRMVRIGFVGELGYEIHVPADYADYLWNTLMEAGAAHGIRPFGVEAQRVLRLEKQHFIVGQDTDALTNPIEANMSWVVRFQKPDFIGKPSVERIQARDKRSILVGFVMEEGVPEEGDQIVEDGALVGRVTSSRYSPTLGKGIGLGWLEPSYAENGTPITIKSHDKLLRAHVHTAPFYDPEGERLKS